MCNLRCGCIVLGALFVGYNALTLYLFINIGDLRSVLIVVGLVGALALLFGAILEHKCLVLVAFIVNLIAIISSLILLLAVICNFEDIRDSFPKSKSTNRLVTGMVGQIVIRLFVTCVAYAYYIELQDSEDE